MILLMWPVEAPRIADCSSHNVRRNGAKLLAFSSAYILHTNSKNPISCPLSPHSFTCNVTPWVCTRIQSSQHALT